jgi:hypothetical protein
MMKDRSFSVAGLTSSPPPTRRRPYSPPLEEAFLPNAEKVVEKARWLFRH